MQGLIAEKIVEVQELRAMFEKLRLQADEQVAYNKGFKDAVGGRMEQFDRDTRTEAI